MVPSTVLLASHDTDAGTANWTGTKSHVIPLYNSLNMKNAKLLLMVTPASCDRKNDIF